MSPNDEWKRRLEAGETADPLLELADQLRRARPTPSRLDTAFKIRLEAQLIAQHPAQESPHQRRLMPLVATLLILMSVALFLILRPRTSAPIVSLQSTPDLPALTPITIDNVNQLTKLASYGNGAIMDAVWVPDSSTLLVAGSMGIWEMDATNLAAGAELIIEEAVNADVIAFNHNTLAFAGTEKNVQVWDYPTRTRQHLLSTDEQYVIEIEISPNGQYIAALGAGTNSTNLYVWELPSGALLWERRVDTYALSFSPDSTQLVYGGGGGNFYIVDVATQELVHQMREDSIYQYNTLNFSADGTQIIGLGRLPQLPPNTYALMIWDIATGTLISRVETPPHSNHMIAQVPLVFTPQQQAFTTMFDRTGMITWQMGQDTMQTLPELDYIRPVAASPDGQTLVGIESNQNVVLIDTRTYAEVGRSIDFEHFSMLGFDANSQLYMLNPDGLIFARDLLANTRTQLAQIVPSPYGSSFEISPNGQYSAILTSQEPGWDKTMYRLELVDRTGDSEPSILFEMPIEWSGEMAFSSDSSMLAYSYQAENGRAAYIDLYDLTKRERISQLSQELSPVNSISFNSIHFINHDTQLLSVHQNQQLQIWDIATGRLLETFGEEVNDLLPMTYYDLQSVLSHDQDRFLLYTHNGLQLYDLRDRALVYHLRLTADYNYRTPTFSPDATMFSLGHTLYDTSTGTPLLEVPAVDQFHFPPDNTYLISEDVNGQLSLWGIPQE